MLLAPLDALTRMMSKGMPGLEGVKPEEMLKAIEQAKLHAPLVRLQDDSLGGGEEEGDQLTMMKLSPNLEIAMYLAQAIGGGIVTDSRHRGSEIIDAILRRRCDPQGGLRELALRIEQSSSRFPRKSAMWSD
jgi:hypothetical protein